MERGLSSFGLGSDGARGVEFDEALRGDFGGFLEAAFLAGVDVPEGVRGAVAGFRAVLDAPAGGVVVELEVEAGELGAGVPGKATGGAAICAAKEGRIEDDGLAGFQAGASAVEKSGVRSSGEVGGIDAGAVVFVTVLGRAHAG